MFIFLFSYMSRVLQNFAYQDSEKIWANHNFDYPNVDIKPQACETSACAATSA